MITLPGIVLRVRIQFLTEPGWQSSLVGILSAASFRRRGGLLCIRHEEGLGMGDVKMLAMIGAFLGWQLTLRRS